MKLTENCYAVLGFGYYPPWVVNAGFITGSKQTLVVDSGPNYLSAQTIYGYAQNVKPQNELIVVNTEKHLDHIGGNCLFNEKGAKIFGHRNINRNDYDLKEDKDYFNNSILDESRRKAREENIVFQSTKIINPGYSVEDNQVFDIGNLSAVILYTFGHTLTNISVHIPSEKVLYCGDCIVKGYMPNLEAGNPADWEIWISSLERILKLDLNFIVPGHGNVIYHDEINDEIKRIITFLEKAIQNKNKN